MSNNFKIFQKQLEKKKKKHQKNDKKVEFSTFSELTDLLKPEPNLETV